MKTLLLLPLLITVSSLGQTSPDSPAWVLPSCGTGVIVAPCSPAKHSTPKKDRAPKLVLPKCDTLDDKASPKEIACEARHNWPIPLSLSLDNLPECQPHSDDMRACKITPKIPSVWKFYCSPQGVCPSDLQQNNLPHDVTSVLDGKVWKECHNNPPQCWEIPGQTGGCPLGAMSCGGGSGISFPITTKSPCDPPGFCLQIAQPSEFIGFAPGCLLTRGDELDECAEWVVPQHTEVKAEKTAVPEPAQPKSPDKPDPTQWPEIVGVSLYQNNPSDNSNFSVSISSDGHSRIATLTQAEKHDLDAATEALEAVKKKIAEAHGVWTAPPPNCDKSGAWCVTTGMPERASDRVEFKSGYIFINVEGK